MGEDAMTCADSGPVRASVRTVMVPVEGDRFAATLAMPSAALPAVIFVPGWNGKQAFELAQVRDAAALGCAALAVDLRGEEAEDPRHGRVTREDNLRDLVAAFDWITARADVDARAIAIVGHSYGAYLAALLTRLRPVQWLALRSPALYPDEGWDLPKQSLSERVSLDAYRRVPHAAESNRALSACAAFGGDVLLVEAQEDDVLPPQVAASYRAALTCACSVTTRTIAGADHALTNPQSRREWAELLEGWFREMIGGARKHAVMSCLEEQRERRTGRQVPSCRAADRDGPGGS